MLKRDLVQNAIDTLSRASRIVVLCHANPDGDAIGSLVGMGLLLEKAYPDKDIIFVVKDASPETFAFLQGTQRMQPTLAMQEGDCIVFLDSAEPKLTGFHETNPEYFADGVSSINIDHHPTNTNFAAINLIDPHAASACEIVAEVADVAGWIVISPLHFLQACTQTLEGFCIAILPCRCIEP